MTTIKMGLRRATALLLMVCLCLSLFACAGEGDENTEPSVPDKVEHSVIVLSDNGQPLVGVGITVYTDATFSELVWFAKTDDTGKITFTDVPSDSYVAVLSNLPKGYHAEEMYALPERDFVITLSAVLEEVEDPATVRYELGDIMNDFTVTDSQGNSYTLSELLKDKDAVVLNFWYLQCDPCKMEFPYLQAAYEAYGENVEVLAMNPYNTNPQEVADFQQENGYTFPMMIAEPGWAEAMDIKAYPTTVVIDRFGTVSMIHTGSITEEGVFESIFAFFGSEEYVPTIVTDLEQIPELEEEVGTADNPIEMGATPSFTISVPAKGEVYLTLYRISSHYLQIRSPYANITYNGKTYTPSNGAVGVSLYADDVMTLVNLVIHNTSDEDQEFHVTMSTGRGTYGNPIPLELGKFTVSTHAGNDQGVFYSYTAQEDGVLTVRCLSAPAGIAYDLVLYNLSTYVYNNLQSYPQKDADGYYYVSVNVKAGNRIQFICGALPDDSGSYPKAEFYVEAMMGEPSDEEEEKTETIMYAVTVTDEYRNPVPGVQIYLDVNGEIKNISTNANGNAYTNLEPGTYSATLKIPMGYDARNTEFQLTQEFPTIALKLDTVVVETATYTVHVLDEDETPVAGALVSIGDWYGYTDETGTVQFTVAIDSYTVAVSADGYADTAASFFDDAMEMTITLVKGETEVENGVNYSVQVVDYFGNPMTGVTVGFQRNGTTVAMKAVDTTGHAARLLESGNYTVTLAFASGAYYYMPANLTEENPAATIVAVAKLSGEYVPTYFGEPYCVNAGATYAPIQSDVVNYFVFSPTVAGYYRITTANSADDVTYWGGNLSYVLDITSAQESSGNGFMLNIKQESVDNDLSFVIGVTGDDSCILVIEWVSEPLTDYYDLPWSTEWMEGATLPDRQITVSASGTLTYMDVTKLYDLVLGTDGYYHVGSADGPVLYLRLDENAPLISFEDLLANGGMKVYFFDEEGNFLKKEEYTDYMNACVTYMDAANGLYPVTEKLAYILKNYGASVDWFNSESASYLFGTTVIEPESAWLFACCYFG